MKIKVKVKQVKEVQEIKTFTKRELICTSDYDTRYSEDISIEFYKDNTSLIDGLSKGDIVEIDFYVKGNYYEPKDAYYTKLVGYAVTVLQYSQPPVISNPKKSDNIPFVEPEEMETPF